MCSRTYESALLPWTCFLTVGSSYYCCVSSHPKLLWHKTPTHILCTDMGQEFEQDKAGIACLWNMTSEALCWAVSRAGMTCTLRTAIIWRYLPSYVWLLILAINWAVRWTVGQNTCIWLLQWPLCVGKCGFHHRMAAGFQEWVSPKQPDGSSPWKTHGITFPTVPQAHLDSRGGNTNPIYRRKES